MWRPEQNHHAVIISRWQFSGYVAVIFLAAIKNVPVNASTRQLDGAYMPRIYWRLSFPQLKGAMGSCITILAMYALRSFDFIVSLVAIRPLGVDGLPHLDVQRSLSRANFAYSGDQLLPAGAGLVLICP